MEFLALGGLVLYGLSQNKKNNTSKKDNKQNKLVKQQETPSKIVNTDPSNIRTINEIEHQRLTNNTYPIVDNVMDALPESSRVSNNVSKPINYESMFEPLKITNNNQVKSFNEAPISGDGENQTLKREIDYLEGFSDFNSNKMDYGVTNDFTHNNMIPSTSQRDMPLMNYDNFNYRLDLQTGSSRDWVPKKEVETMFAPIKSGKKTIEGQPAINGQLGSRFITSFKNNMGNLPFQNKVKVRPGIDGEIQKGKHSTYRVLPRNIDELRSEINQKLVYEQPMIESAKKGNLPTQIGNYKTLKHNFKERSTQQGKSYFSKAVPRPQLSFASGNRSNELQYQGPAINNSGNIVHSKYEESGRQNFNGDSMGRNLYDTSQGVNVTKESIQQYANNRDSTSHNIAGIAGESQATYTNLTDNARKTIKQTTLSSREGNTNPYNHKSYSNLQDNMKTTIKQTTLYNRDGNINTVNEYGSYSNLQDEVKPTIKQTTLFNREGNMNTVNDYGTYSNLQDDMKTTIKQTTLFNREGNMNTVNDYGTYSNLQDEAKPTIKHSTLYSHEGNVNSAYDHATYTELTDEARTTIKETTLSDEKFRMRGYDKSYARDKNFVANPTIKHSTLFATPEQNLSNPGHSVDRQIIMDKARPTIKQTTLLEGHVNPLGNVEKKARVFDDALNMQIDDCKEMSLKTRPHQGGDQKYRKYYNDDADTRQRLFINSAREPNFTRPLDYQTPDPNISRHTRIRDSSVIDNYHITDNFTNTLEDNPLVNDLRHQKNINFTL